MGKSQTIEIIGAGFSNKGAELMTDAICDVIHEKCPSSRLTVHWTIGSYENRAARRIHNKFSIRRLGRCKDTIGKLLPTRARDLLGIVLEHEIDVVLDASGFAYSDQWGAMASRQAAEWANSKEGRDKKFILLPQALGPFEDPEVRRHALSYFQRALLIYARDEKSLRYARELLGSADKLKLAPDFTCVVKPDEVPRPTSAEYACIVPNCRMLDMLGDGQGDDYYEQLLRLGKHLLSRELTVVLVNHEGAEDLAIVKRLENDLGEGVMVVPSGSGKYLKGIFRDAKMVIGSRFHALISSLTQGVPVIGMGWSHKYECLFSDFGCSEYLASISTSEDSLVRMVEALLNESIRSEVVAAISKGITHYKTENSILWDTVIQELDCEVDD